MWVAPIDESGAPAGTPEPVSETDIDGSLGRWSPDGTRLAYAAQSLDDEAHGGELRIRELATGHEVVVCVAPAPIAELEWSPDGARLAFVARDPDPHVYGAFGVARKDKDTPARSITTFFTRLDGEGWVYDRPTRVFVVDASVGATAQVLTPGPFQAANPAWSPDATAIAFASARHETWDRDLAVDLFTVRADASAEPVQVTRTGGSFQHPAFAFDGASLLALLDPDPRSAPNHVRLVRVDLVGGEVTELAGELDRNKASFPGTQTPVPQPDSGVLFTYEDSGAVHVGRVGPDGGTDVLVGGSRWVGGIDRRADIVAFTAADDTHTADVFTVALSTRIEQRITDHAEKLRAEGCDPAPMQRFVALSADGTEVECWALRPEGNGPFPTLLNVHGGPFTQYGYKLFDEFQIQIGAGFAVVLCNPRGSSGYSQAWGRAIRWPGCQVDPGSGWGGVDYDDVMACADAAVAQLDWIDADRMGVLGGSYGGYMTSWVIGHTDRFKAACSERSVNNLLTEEHNSDIASAFEDTIGTSYLDDVAAYTSRSPIAFVREMRTPLLILHSENDLRCPINQAEELFVSLRLLGRTPEFWRFPGECHELSRSGAPAHRVQRAEILVDFFGRHLRQP